VRKRLEEYLREQHDLALPKSQFGKAINYALNQWEALLRYASDGRLEIDNNSSERTLRPCAIGRRYAQFPIMLTDTSKRRNCCGGADVAARLGLHNPACPWASTSRTEGEGAQRRNRPDSRSARNPAGSKWAPLKYVGSKAVRSGSRSRQGTADYAERCGG
jgi:hypothetical protein